MACSGGATAPAGPTAPAADAQRLRLLGGVPPADAARGLYVVDLEAAVGDLSPGSRVGPFLGGVLEQAQLLVETNAPPVTLLGGIPDSVETPEHAERVDDALVFAEPETVAVAAGRLRQHATPDDALAGLAASAAPVAWIGPTPSPAGTGRTLIEMDAKSVTFTVTPTITVDEAAAFATDQLATSGPPGSPGKPWSTVLTDIDVTTSADAVVITAKPSDLPGPLLRSLVDQRQLSFLPG